MDNRKDIQKELEELAPFLSKMDKKDGFVAPDKYFDKLSDNILRQVEQKENQVSSPKVTFGDKIWQIVAPLFQPRMAMGLATVALLLVATFFWLNSSIDTTKMATSDELSEEMIAAYISTNIDDFDEDWILDSENIGDLDGLFDGFNEDEIDQYLEEMMDNWDTQAMDDLL